MPANVDQAFERGVSALFPKPAPAQEEPVKPANVYRVWNRLAVKFPMFYEFCTVGPKVRLAEEKLLILFKLNPRDEADRAKLGTMLEKRLEKEESGTLECALDNWWKEASHEG